MKYFWICTLLTAIGSVIISCKDTVKYDNKNQQETIVSEFPEAGTELVPVVISDFQVNDGSKATSKNNRLEAALRVILLLQQQTGTDYHAFISTRNNSGNGYRYRYLRFNPGEDILNKADGVMLYAYSEESPGEEGHSRYMLASIPKSDEALSLIRNWAKGTETNSTSGKSTENNLIVNSTSCTYIDEQYCVETGDEDYPFFCWHYVEESCPGNGGDDPEWPDDPDGNEDECDDPFGCDPDPGGNNDPSGSGDTECDETAIDGGCNDWEEDDPEPCSDTNDQFLDNESFQMLMQQAATESGFDESEDNRLEGFYIVKPQNGGFTKELIPYSNRTSCSFDISTTASFFEDAVALLHTHPYAPNEVVKNQDCLERRGWNVEKDGYPKYIPRSLWSRFKSSWYDVSSFIYNR
jgi:hypothetical protein